MRTLITGCSTGIGRAAAIELTKRGHEVVATARRTESIEDLDVALALALDVDDEASIARAHDAAGEIDVLVNNAGFGVVGPVERVPLDEIRRVFETNVFGLIRMTQAFLPQMRERGNGTIVNVSSIAGRVAAPLNAFYAATKHAVEAISESLHYEMSRFGVRVAIVEPGRIETRFRDNERFVAVDEAPYDELHEMWQNSLEKLVSGDPPGPEIVAQAIADAIEADPPKLRWPVGEDTELVLSVRESMDFESFEATMRKTLELDW